MLAGLDNFAKHVMPLLPPIGARAKLEKSA
jgi:hypothetical protein